MDQQFTSLLLPVLRKEMALFTAASKHFVKSAGNSSLHYVPDLSSADRFTVLCLVYRKRSFWLWKKPKILQTMLTLGDIIDTPLNSSGLTTSKVVAEGYQDTPSFNADGDIGAKIASELDIDLSMTDKFSLTVKFGDIVKTEVKWEQLQEILEKAKVKTDHEIFKELKERKRTTLCVVLESLSCKKDSALDEKSDMTEKGKVSTTIPSTVSVNVHMEGQAEEIAHHSYSVPAGTVIAFSCTNVDLDSSGLLSMHVGVDKVDYKEGEIAANMDQSEEIKQELTAFVESKRGKDLKAAVLDIFASPKCIEEMLELASTARCTIEERQKFSLPAGSVSAKFSDVKDWKKFLELIGFNIPEDDSMDSKIEFPTEDQENLVQSCWALLESAADLTEESISMFLRCRPDYKDTILTALCNAMKKKSTSYAEAGKIIDKNEHEMMFLKSLGFHLMEESGGKCLSFKWNSDDVARDAYAVVYALL